MLKTQLKQQSVATLLYNKIGKSDDVSENKFITVLQVVLLNLIKNYKNGNVYTSYYRFKNAYKVKSRYNSYGIDYKTMVNVVDRLYNSCFIDNHLGFYDRKPLMEGWRRGGSRLSRMIARESLIVLLEEYGLNGSLFVKNTDAEVIILKDDNGDRIEYGASAGKAKDSPVVVRMRNRLKKINDLLLKTDITLPLSCTELLDLNARRKYESKLAIIFDQKLLYRVFNGSFARGGRFYGGWWENTPKDLRKKILINGESVVERDYKAIHPTMMYLKSVERLPDGDPYVLDGFEHDMEMRFFVKIAMLVLINAKSKTAASRALNNKFDVNKGVPEDIVKKFRAIGCSNLLNKIENRHSAISDKFGTGYGSVLQFLDSEIADGVLFKMYEKGIPCLPVHDSFIVQSRYDNELVSTMKEAFYEKFKEYPVVD